MKRPARAAIVSALAFSMFVLAKAAPTINSLNPSSIEAGSGAFTMTINGSGFDAPVAVVWSMNSNTTLLAASLDRNRVQTTIPSQLVAAPGEVSVRVLNTLIIPSNSLTFQITSPPVTSPPAALPLAITGPGVLPQATVGVPYSQSFSASGGVPPYVWSVASGSLPAGLSLDPGGTLSGTPTAETTATFTIAVRDAAGATASQQYALQVISPLAITIASLPDGMVGSAYSVTLTATGGSPPYSWAISSGSLPAGLSLDPAGKIQGTPGDPGTSVFTLQATDRAGASSTQPMTLVIAAALAITTQSLPNGTVGVPYSATLTASGGTAPYEWSVQAGSLPAGLSLNKNNGQITGTPSAAGNSTFTVQVQDKSKNRASKQLSITVIAPLKVTTTSLPGGIIGTAYSQNLAATGGSPPYTWSVSSGSLPGGLTMNSSGQISGTPSSAGTFNFTAQVKDASGATATAPLGIQIISPLSVTTSSLPGGVVGRAYSQALAASGGIPPYRWSVASGNLPAGLTLSSGGQISGTPTAAGSAGFTVTVTDTLNGTASAQLSIQIIAPLAIGTASLPGGVVGMAYSQTLAASGGTPPYRWSVANGALPAGLSLAADTGVVSGTPTSAGSSTFSIAVSDAAGQTATKPFSIAVTAALAILTDSLPAGNAGASYNFALTAGGGTPPYVWSISAGGLPPGIALNSATGALTGTPLTSGSFNFTAQVADAASAKATKALQITIVSSLSIDTGALPNGTAGLAYSVTMAASGGTRPYTWSVTSGQLPPGVSLDARAGTIAGTPTQAGTFTFSIGVTDSGGGSTSRTYTVSIGSALSITSTQLPAAASGAPYSFALAAIGGVAPYRWNILTGTLPNGLALDGSTGVISGTTTATGNYNLTIGVSDAQSNTAQKQFTLLVAAGLSVSTAAPMPGAAVGTPYSQTLAAVAGTPPYRWAIVAGSLPPGLTLDASSGAITGQPTTPGTSNFTVQVTDAAGGTATKALALTVGSVLSIGTGAELPGGVIGKAYSTQLSASGGVAPYSWTVSSGALPDGLTLDPSTGAIAGTPAKGGNFSFTVLLTDAARNTANQNFSLAVGAEGAPVLSINGLPATADPVQQPTIEIALSSPYSLPITGQLTLAFEPDASVPADDPAIQFSTGGRTANFSIPANTTRSAGTTLAIQTGSVSGTIVISATAQAAGAPLQAPAPVRVKINRSAPLIRSVRVVKNAAGFEVWVTGLSTPRDLTQATFHFTAGSGADLRTTDVTVPLSDPAKRWYQDAGSTQYGSQFTIVQPFSVQGDGNAVASVSVTLANSVGGSQAASANF